MKINLFLLAFTFATVNFQAQQAQSHKKHKDSLRLQFSIDSNTIFKKRPVTIYASLDFRNAYIGKRFLSFAGPLGGVTINNKHIIGIGYYFLNKFSPFRSDKLYTYSFEKINYVTAFYQYVLYDSKRFDLLLPVELGYGKYKATLEDGNDNPFVESVIFPSAIGLRCVFLPHRWIGIKLGAGYRYVWEKSSQIGLDGVYFAVGIKIDLRHMYRDYKYFRLKQHYKQALKKV